MTSSSSLGSTRIILQFDFDRISTAQRVMCRRRSTLHKVCSQWDAQPPDLSQSEPVGCANMILTLTSDTYSQGELYDFATRSWLRRFRKSTVLVMSMSEELTARRTRRAESAGAV